MYESNPDLSVRVELVLLLGDKYILVYYLIIFLRRIYLQTVTEAVK